MLITIKPQNAFTEGILLDSIKSPKGENLHMGRFARAALRISGFALPLAVLTISPLIDACSSSKQGEKTIVMQVRKDSTNVAAESVQEQAHSKKTSTVFLHASDGERRVIQIDEAALQRCRETFLEEVQKIRTDPKSYAMQTHEIRKKPGKPYMRQDVQNMAQYYADVLTSAPDSIRFSPRDAHSYKSTLNERYRKFAKSIGGTDEAILSDEFADLKTPAELENWMIEDMAKNAARSFLTSHLGHAAVVLYQDRKDFPVGIGISCWNEYDQSSKSWKLKAVLVYDVGTRMLGEK